MCLPLSVDLDACVTSVRVAVVLVDADFLFSSYVTWALALFFFGDADVLTRVAVVSTGRG